ncbi:hypothetical protein [Chamaesiphon sp.]|uniref:hypothetical protein n=1 Tax=Chamaesiphon sp. TaxID=2814140 RepID=UPI0035936DF0
MEAKLVVTQSSNSIAPSQREIETLSVPAFSFTSLMVVSAIGVAIYAYIFKRSDRALALKQSQEIMCRRCEFFSDNHYLKCTLHPTTVLTAQAINCRDCRLKSQAKWLGKIKGILQSLYSFFNK